MIPKDHITAWRAYAPFDVAMNTVLERIIAELPGDRWKGPSE